jgi:hypothetical protein
MRVSFLNQKSDDPVAESRLGVTVMVWLGHSVLLMRLSRSETGTACPRSAPTAPRSMFPRGSDDAALLVVWGTQ